MKTSVMVFHPNIARSRINAALMERAQNEPELDLVVRDMYALYPDFHINVDVWPMARTAWCSSSRSTGTARPR